MVNSVEVRLASRPDAGKLPSEANFKLATVDVPELADGQVLIKNTVMSVDPYMRGRMNDVKSYIPPFQIDEALTGGVIGTVVASKNSKFPEGTVVSHFLGWREFAVSDGKGLQPIKPADGVPVSAYLGVLGMPAMTAYFGLKDIGALKAGETVFVSAAAGAVGSFAVQMAKLRGCTVVGAAGSDEKVALLKEAMGCDAAFNRRTHAGRLTAALAEAAPQGVDVYFDNVGGEHLEAAINCMNNYGRIVACGMISTYNDSSVAAPRNLQKIIGKRIRMEGLICTDKMPRVSEFFAEAVPWVTSGALKGEETVVDGIKNAPAAFLSLFAGANKGKLVVRLDVDAAKL